MTAHIGEPIPRREDVRLLTGAGRYVDDVHLDGMLHAAVFRSAWPHGRIRSIDIDRCRRRARCDRRIHPCGLRSISEADPFSNCRDARLREFPSAAARYRQGSVCRRAHRRRGRDQPLHRGGRRFIDFGRDRDLPPILNWEAANDRSVLIHEARRDEYVQHRSRPRRHGCGLQDCVLRAPRALHRAAAYRRSHGGARAGRGLGRRRSSA